jgi:hypothetical protein
VHNDYWIGRTPTDPADARRMPTHGMMVLSPIWLTAQYDPARVFESFKGIPPQQVIGHCLLVYDLDKINRPFSREAN